MASQLPSNGQAKRSLPTLVFLPGAWHTPDYFTPLIEALKSHTPSIPALAIQPAVVNSVPPALSYRPDSEAAKKAIVGLLKEGKDVVVVMHSYGGIYGTDAVGGILCDGEDQYLGRIRRVVYATAYMPRAGESPTMVNYEVLAPDLPPLEFMVVDAGGYMNLNKAIATEIFYHDLPPDTAAHYTFLLGRHPMAAMLTPIDHCGWLRVPSTYVYCTQDRVMPLGFQQYQVQRARGDTEKENVQAFSGELGEFSVECGHTPFLAKTEEMVQILVKIVKES